MENSDRSIKCTDTEEITWYFGHPDRHSIPLDLDEGLDTETGQYVSTLNLNDPLSDQHVGYYYCLRKAEAEEFPTERSLVELFQEKPDQVNRIYVYLDCMCFLQSDITIRYKRYNYFLFLWSYCIQLSTSVCTSTIFAIW